jgi:hypothetical protein
MMVSFQLLSFDIYNKQLSNYLFSGTVDSQRVQGTLFMDILDS